MVGYEDIVYEEVLHQNEAVNAVKNWWKNCTDICRKSAPHWLIIKAYCSYTRPYVAQVTQQKIVALNIEVLPYPPYSTDFALVFLCIETSRILCIRNQNFAK